MGDYMVTVCAECHTASCWHGEFMCNDARNAGTVEMKASELLALKLEHPDRFSPAKLEAVTGEAPVMLPELIPDPRDARIAALEGEVAGLRATLDIPAGMDNHIHFRPRWATEFMGGPVSPEVLRHNAYTMGWVDGAIDDYRIDGPNEKGGAYRDDYQSGVDAGKAARGGAWAEAKRRKTGEPLSEPAPLRLGRGPTLEEVDACPEPGLWFTHRPDHEPWEWELRRLRVDTDGEYAGMIVADFSDGSDDWWPIDLDDAVCLSSSRQPCGVGEDRP